MKRRIIEIDEALCNGCGICADACHESAIQMIDGKAKLVSDQYCDGLGDCLPACPTGAITMIEREADAYSQDAVDERLKAIGKAPQDEFNVLGTKHAHGHHTHGARHHHGHGGGCPGSRAQQLKPKQPPMPQTKVKLDGEADYNQMMGQLTTWPVQLHLVNPNADYLKQADILIAADCTAFAYGNFHNEFIRDKVTIIGCPKLDDNAFYAEKLTQIFANNQPKSITVVRMEVPCCGGIIQSVKQAMLQSATIVPYNEITITVNGTIQ